MLDLAAFSVFVMLGVGVCATQSDSPGLRALGKTLCVLTTLLILLAIALVCWIIVAWNMTG
jgi:hypothetical protein